MNLPEPIRTLIERLSELPSIGPRQATRLVFTLIHKGQNSIRSLAESVNALSEIKQCSRCFCVHQNEAEFCDICSDKSRTHSLIAVIEKETDLLSIENTGRFRGRYFILGPIPKTGILRDAQKLRLQSLKSFIERELGGKAEEIIIALNPTANGDFNASLIMNEIAPMAKKITRLGRGLPTGGEIEFADDETLGAALMRRS